MTSGGARRESGMFDAAKPVLPAPPPPPAPAPPPSTIPLYWHWSENFGDRISPWLVEKISGRSTHLVPPSDEGQVPYMVTGSILTHAVKRGIVWGSGCAFADDLAGLSPPSPSFRILATRGPLSAAAVRAAGHTPSAHLDPGFLLSRFLPRAARSPSVKMGILCSWVDHAQATSAYGSAMPVVNALAAVEDVVNTIVEWEIVVSSCLHGIVAAIAYGKPVVWARFSDRMMGDGFKFRDLFASLGVDLPKVVDLSEVLEPRAIAEHATMYDPPDTQALMACCPFVPGKEI